MTFSSTTFLSKLKRSAIEYSRSGRLDSVKDPKQIIASFNKDLCKQKGYNVPYSN